MGKVLVLFEKSGVVREAFRSKGHYAYSVDMEPPDDESQYHETCKVETFLTYNKEEWDLIIMHPPCTALAVSGNAHYALRKPKHEERVRALYYTINLWEYAIRRCKRVCLENPVGVLSKVLFTPQYIQPYEFGHNASKKTGLWLRNLPKLKGTERVRGRMVNGKERFDNQTDSGQNRLPPSEDRADKRSRTYEGIAKAMAEQWGELIENT